MRSFKLHVTSHDPKEEIAAIVDSGPFILSRYPAYVSADLLQAALGLLFNNVWILLFIIPALIVIHYVVVLKCKRLFSSCKFLIHVSAQLIHLIEEIPGQFHIDICYSRWMPASRYQSTNEIQLWPRLFIP